MFTSFSNKEEECLSALIEGRGHIPPAGTPGTSVESSFVALNICRSEIVRQLQSTDTANAREQLRLLYEGFSALIDFLEKRRLDAGRRFENSFIVNESVPAVRGF